MDISPEELAHATRIVAATPTEHLLTLLEENQGKHEKIIHLIESEIELRGQGVKRIPTIEEARMLYGND